MATMCAQAEHRLVTGARRRATMTLLFCDLRGFTPIAARLDPNEVHAMLTAYYEMLSPLLVAHGGRIVQYTGDEIFAVFEGERDADRALDASLALTVRLDELNHWMHHAGLPPLQLGIGLHRGTVVVSEVSFGALQQVVVMGDPVNVARRYCTAAAPGQIVFSPAVRVSARSLPAYRTIVDVALKGVEAGVRLHVVVQPARSAVVAAPRTALATPRPGGRWRTTSAPLRRRSRGPPRRGHGQRDRWRRPRSAQRAPNGPSLSPVPVSTIGA